jgi:hypothetical protein
VPGDGQVLIAVFGESAAEFPQDAGSQSHSQRQDRGEFPPVLPTEAQPRVFSPP